MKHKLFFLGIILLASLLRITNLNSFPDGLHFQEAAVGWRAQNLLNYGKDEFGRSYPLYFSNGSAIEMPLTTYLTVPFTALSPTNIFFLRLPFALLGVLLIVGSILLTAKLFPDKKNLSLATGFMLAISPVLIWFSRIVNPQIIAFNLIVWGLYLFYSGKKVLGTIILSLSILATADVFILIAGLIILLLWKSKSYRQFLPAGFILLGFLVLFFINKIFYTNWLENNFSLFKDTSIISDINLIRGQNLAQGLPNILNSIFFNKAYYLIFALKNFLSYFNLSYIFAKGDGTFINGFSNFGPMLLVSFPLFIIGFYNFIKNKYSNKKLIFGLIVITAFSASFILNAPDTGRFVFTAFPLSLVIGIGFLSLGKIFKSIFLILIFFNLSVICYDAINKEVLRQQPVFMGSSRELVNFIGQKTSGNVWLTDEVDQNIALKIGFYSQVPYSQTSLKDNPVNIYKQRVKQINNIYVGHKDVLKQNPKNFDYIIKSAEEKYYGCFKEQDSFGEDDKKYILLVRYTCDDETLER